MIKKMTSFIGAGNVGTSLGVFFKENGIAIRGYFSRTFKSAETTAAHLFQGLHPAKRW